MSRTRMSSYVGGVGTYGTKVHQPLALTLPLPRSCMWGNGLSYALSMQALHTVNAHTSQHATIAVLPTPAAESHEWHIAFPRDLFLGPIRIVR